MATLLDGIGGYGGPLLDTTYYGKKEYSSINDPNHNVKLNGTRVEGEARAEGSVTVKEATVGSIVAGAGVDLTDTICLGSVVAIEGIIAASSEMGEVDGKGFINFENCKKVTSIKAQGIVTLKDSKISKDVFTIGDVDIQNSTIGGRLTCSSNHLVLKNCEIDTLELRCPKSKNLGTSLWGGRPILSRKRKKEEEKSLPQILELENCKVKHVIFEGGQGKVIPKGTSSKPESIVGGVLEFAL